MVDTEGGAQQDRLVGGSQVICERMAEELGDSVVLDAPGRARSSRTANGVAVAADGLARRRPARGRGDAAGADHPDPLRPGALGPPRPARPVDGERRADQVHRGLRRALLARGRADRRGASATIGPVETTFDNSPPDGSPGVMLGFIAGPAAIEHAAQPESERRRIVLECFARLFGERAPQRLAPTSSRPGPRRSGAAAGPVCSPAPGRAHRLRRGAAPPVRAGPLGGRRDGDRLVRLHGRRGAQRRARGRRDPRCGRMAAVSAATTRLAFAGAARQAEMLRDEGGLLAGADRALPGADRADRSRAERLPGRLGRAGAGGGRRRRRAARRRRGARRCSGVPIAIKDTLDVAGDVTMLGTAAYDEPAERGLRSSSSGCARPAR